MNRGDHNKKLAELPPSRTNNYMAKYTKSLRQKEQGNGIISKDKWSGQVHYLMHIVCKLESKLYVRER